MKASQDFIMDKNIKYVREHRLAFLFNGMIEHVLETKPENPMDNLLVFLEEKLEAEVEAKAEDDEAGFVPPNVGTGDPNLMSDESPTSTPAYGSPGEEKEQFQVVEEEVQQQKTPPLSPDSELRRDVSEGKRSLLTKTDITPDVKDFVHGVMERAVANRPPAKYDEVKPKKVTCTQIAIRSFVDGCLSRVVPQYRPLRPPASAPAGSGGRVTRAALKSFVDTTIHKVVPQYPNSSASSVRAPVPPQQPANGSPSPRRTQEPVPLQLAIKQFVDEIVNKTVARGRGGEDSSSPGKGHHLSEEDLHRVIGRLQRVYRGFATRRHLSKRLTIAQRSENTQVLQRISRQKAAQREMEEKLDASP